MADAATAEPLLETPLAALHRELGARMVPFAGYTMPVQYPTGIIAEHRQVRERAGLFDVSHMGQAAIVAADHNAAARALESLTPGDFAGLAPGRMRYSLLLTDDGGVTDDLMVSRPGDPAGDGTLGVVVNASRKAVDYDVLRRRLPADARLDVFPDRALIALQGPLAVTVVARHVPAAAQLAFMSVAPVSFGDIATVMSRSGYTGEDGFEISVAAADAERLARLLLADPEVLPIGLGARDSLRLEAGLCLYGNDLDETTSPIEADLAFAVAKRRRVDADFPGAARIDRELYDQPARKRVGLMIEGKIPAREHSEIRDLLDGPVGVVTSGGYGPTVGGPIAMGYVSPALAQPGTRLLVNVRGKNLAATVTPLPFVPHRYFRQKKA